MRTYNKIFVIALPRCATVSMSDALGVLGIKTAHLGRIYGESSLEHNNPRRLRRMHEQLSAGDDRLDILDECDGLVDYPICCMDVLQRLDHEYPGSLFINVRRDREIQRWLQSVERQFIGLQLLKQAHTASREERQFIQDMLSFRGWTFGQRDFAAGAYQAAYWRYQENVANYFSGRPNCLLNIENLDQLETRGFEQLADFLQCTDRIEPHLCFPNCNAHSRRPRAAFIEALERGEVISQTGILPRNHSGSC